MDFIVRYLDNKFLRECANEEDVIIQTPAIVLSGRMTKKYWGIPLSSSGQGVAGFSKEATSIKGNDVHWEPMQAMQAQVQFSIGMKGGRSSTFIPVVLARTQNHLLMTAQAQQVGLEKWMNIIGSTFLFLFVAGFIAIFILAKAPFYFLAIAVAICIVNFLSAYLFFAKKRYVFVAPLDALKRSDANAQTVFIDGEFQTGIPSFRTTSIESEFYVGENYDSFTQR